MAHGTCFTSILFLFFFLLSTSPLVWRVWCSWIRAVGGWFCVTSGIYRRKFFKPNLTDQKYTFHIFHLFMHLFIVVCVFVISFSFFFFLKTFSFIVDARFSWNLVPKKLTCIATRITEIRNTNRQKLTRTSLRWITRIHAPTQRTRTDRDRNECKARNKTKRREMLTEIHN